MKDYNWAEQQPTFNWTFINQPVQIFTTPKSKADPWGSMKEIAPLVEVTSRTVFEKNFVRICLLFIIEIKSNYSLLLIN